MENVFTLGADETGKLLERDTGASEERLKSGPRSLTQEELQHVAGGWVAFTDDGKTLS